jgi:hypothetical protein
MSWGDIRKAASGNGREAWERAMDSLMQSGFPDSQMRLDTGHRLWVYHLGEGGRTGGIWGESQVPGYHAQVWHPAGDTGHNVEARLGHDPDHVGPLLRGVFGRRDVQQHLRDQMDRAQGIGPDQTGNRLHIDVSGGH